MCLFTPRPCCPVPCHVPQSPVQGAKVHSRCLLDECCLSASLFCMVINHWCLLPGNALEAHQRFSSSALGGLETASWESGRKLWPLAQNSVFCTHIQVVSAPLPPDPAVLGEDTCYTKNSGTSSKQTLPSVHCGLGIQGGLRQATCSRHRDLSALTVIVPSALVQRGVTSGSHRLWTW